MAVRSRDLRQSICTCSLLDHAIHRSITACKVGDIQSATEDLNCVPTEWQRLWARARVLMCVWFELMGNYFNRQLQSTQSRLGTISSDYTIMKKLLK